MPSIIPWRRLLSPQDTYFLRTHHERFPEYQGNGGNNAPWNSIKPDFVSGVRSFRNVTSAFNAFTDFKVLSQSALVSRVGINIIFDPATPSVESYYRIDAPFGGVSRGTSPWDAVATHGAGEIPYPDTDIDDISSGAENVGPADWEWFANSSKVIAYSEEFGWVTAGSPDIASAALFLDGKRQQRVSVYYNRNSWAAGRDALSGGLPWTVENMVPRR